MTNLPLVPMSVETIFSSKPNNVSYGAVFPIKNGDSWESIPFFQVRYRYDMGIDVRTLLGVLEVRIDNLIRVSKLNKKAYESLIQGLGKEYPKLHFSYVEWNDLLKEVNKLWNKNANDHLDAMAYSIPLIYPISDMGATKLGVTTSRFTASAPNESNESKEANEAPVSNDAVIREKANEEEYNKLLHRGLGTHLYNGIGNLYRIHREGYTLQIVEKETGFTMPVARFINPQFYPKRINSSVDTHNQLIKMLADSFVTLVTTGDLTKKSYEIWLSMSKPYLQEHRTYELLTQMVLGAETLWEK